MPERHPALTAVCAAATTCLTVALSLSLPVGVVAASTSTNVNIDALYNLVDVALTASTYLGPFFIFLGGVMWGVEQFGQSRDASKALKYIRAGLLLTGFSFGIGILIGIIQFVAEGV